jgi:hypothetical protein
METRAGTGRSTGQTAKDGSPVGVGDSGFGAGGECGSHGDRERDEREHNGSGDLTATTECVHHEDDTSTDDQEHRHEGGDDAEHAFRFHTGAKDNCDYKWPWFGAENTGFKGRPAAEPTMTTVAVLADPPRAGLVLSDLVATAPIDPDAAADLYAAMLADVCRAVESSGGDLLVNYRADDDIPEDYTGDQDAEAEVRAAIRPALEDPDAARFEVQVGSTHSGRVGNTVTHLIDQEEVSTAAVVEPRAVFLARQQVDNAAMKLRRNDVVLGPSEGGRVYYAGFGEAIDFEDAFAPPAVETLTDRAVDAGLEADFLPMQPVLETGSDLPSVLSLLRARERAGHPVPTATADCLAELGLVVESDGGELVVARE